MKGKKILALASIFASAAIVGSTLALWAVTDNANKFDVDISPGTISDDTVTKPVTLSYGDRSYANVGNIVNGTKRLAAAVELKAAWVAGTEDTSFTGQFQLELTQNKASGEKLIDHLTTYVYDTAPTIVDGVVTQLNGTLLGTVLPTATNHKGDVPVTVENDEGVGTQTVYVIVEYSADASLITTLANDKVTLSMDWNKIDGLAQTYTIYYSGSVTSGYTPYIYAWSKTGDVVTGQNSDYPGKPMTKVRDGLYAYEINKAFTYFILGESSDGTVAHSNKYIQDDIALDSWAYNNHLKDTDLTNDTPCYNGSSWIAVPEETAALTHDYYLAGSFNSWSRVESYGLDYLASVTAPDVPHYRISGVELAVGDQFKIVNKDYNQWFVNESVWEAIADKVEVYYDAESFSTNMKVIKAGTYQIDFYQDSANPIVIS